MKKLLLRAAALIFMFVLLVGYLYLIQLELDSAAKGSWRRAGLFALTIFGAGLIWDVSKHVAQLEFDSLTGFLKAFLKSLLYLGLYAASALTTYALTNVWAGPQTVLSPFVAVVAAFSCYLCIREGSKAIEHATGETGAPVAATGASQQGRGVSQ